VSIPPFRLRFENNNSFEHRERRWIGRGIGASRFAQDMIDFRKIHQDLTCKLQKFLRRAGHPGGCRDVLACIIHKSGAPKNFFVRAKQA